MNKSDEYYCEEKNSVPNVLDSELVNNIYNSYSESDSDSDSEYSKDKRYYKAIQLAISIINKKLKEDIIKEDIIKKEEQERKFKNI